MLDLTLFECFTSPLSHQPSFVLAMIDVQPHISWIYVSNEVISDGGSFTFKEGKI